MQRTEKGISLLSNARTSVELLVVDVELLFTVTSRFFGRKKYDLNDYNRRMIIFMNKFRIDFDEVQVCVVNDYDYCQMVAGILRLDYPLTDMQSESNYRQWLGLMNPTQHLATPERRYYNKNSRYLNINEI